MSLFSQKKRLLVLFGSPHGHGHTHRLLEAFLHPFRGNHDWEVEQVDLYELSPHPCTGCGACAKEESCAFEDLDPLDKALRKCDLLVVASEGLAGSDPAVF